MKVEILQRPANTIAKLTVDSSEQLTAEGGSMVAMSEGFNVETTTHKKGKGSFINATKRMFAGESIFMNEYECHKDGAELFLAPSLSGDIIHKKLGGNTLVVQGQSYLASWGGVDMDLSWGGFKSIIGKEGAFWMKLSGEGEVLINSFGAIYPVEIDGEYICDTGHIVAFDDSLEFKLSKVGGSYITSFLGGEGFVSRFSGKGTLWCQSHSQSSFGYALGPLLRSR